MATVVYDGDCGFCRDSVEWARRRARRPLAFVTAASAAAELAQRGLVQRAQRSVLVLGPRRAHDQSAAVVRVLWRLRAPWPAAAAALWLIPKPLRDIGYRVVARRGRRGRRGPGRPN